VRYEIELGRGEDRPIGMNQLRECVDNVVNGTWEETFAELAMYVE
jgi:hypothetical protein